MRTSGLSNTDQRSMGTGPAVTAGQEDAEGATRVGGFPASPGNVQTSAGRAAVHQRRTADRRPSRMRPVRGVVVVQRTTPASRSTKPPHAGWSDTDCRDGQARRPGETVAGWRGASALAARARADHGPRAAVYSSSTRRTKTWAASSGPTACSCSPRRTWIGPPKGARSRTTTGTLGNIPRVAR